MPDLPLWHSTRQFSTFSKVRRYRIDPVKQQKNLLESLASTQGVGPEEIAPVLKRWGEIEAADYRGKPLEGFFTHLTLTQELRCLIAALYCHRPTGKERTTQGNIGIVLRPEMPRVT